MKKLILYDHLGNKLLEQEVFVEGQDFHTTLTPPKAFWLGDIYIVDKEPEPELKVEPLFEEVSEPMTEVEEAEITVNVAEDAAYEAARQKAEEEVKVEFEEVNNQSAGESGVSEASEPESAEGLSQDSAGEESD